MAKKKFINEMLSEKEINSIFFLLKDIATNIFEYENFDDYNILENILFFNGVACLFYDKHKDSILPLKLVILFISLLRAL